MSTKFYDHSASMKLLLSRWRLCNRNLSSEWISNFAFRNSNPARRVVVNRNILLCNFISFPQLFLNNGFGKSSLEFANLKANKAIQFRSLLFEFISSCLRFRLFPESLSFEHISSSSAHHKPRKTTANLIKRKLCHQKIIQWPLLSRNEWEKVFIVKKCCRLIGEFLKGHRALWLKVSRKWWKFVWRTKKIGWWMW